MARRRRRRADEFLGCGHRSAPGGDAVLGGRGGAGGRRCLLLQGAVSQRIAGAWDRRDQPPAQGCGGLGRTPRYGRKWTLARLLTVETPERDRLTLYGKLATVVFVVRDVWLRDVAQKVRVVVLEGAKEPIVLVSTDLALSALQIIEI